MISVIKKIKRTLVSIVASAMCVTGGIGTISASAASPSQATFNFNLGQGGSDYSSSAPKLNELAYSTAMPTGGFLSTTIPLYLRIYNNSHTSALSNSEEFTYLYQQENIHFTTVTPSINTYICLKGNAGYYGVEVVGVWTP